jgi:DNA-binding NarL/FixJ family response regulator
VIVLWVPSSTTPETTVTVSDQAAPRLEGFPPIGIDAVAGAGVADRRRPGPPDANDARPADGTAWLTPAVYSVVIIDDQPIARAGMERLIGDHPQLDVVASVSSVAEFDTATRGRGCDVVVVAVPGHGENAEAETVARLAKAAHPVVASTWDRPMALAQAFRAGARGCVTRHSSHQEMLTALRVVATGGLYVCAALVERLRAEVGRTPQQETVRLAPREIETVRWIALGFTQAQIATRMGLSLTTVNTYAKRVRSKLRVTNKADLTRMAIRLGYLKEERTELDR